MKHSVPPALKSLVLLLALLSSCAPLTAGPSAQRPAPQNTTVGPEAGFLVIAGGGNLDGTGIVEEFLELAGGPDALIVIIPTANGDSLYTSDWSGLDPLYDAGASNLSILHTYDPDEADSEAFTAPLREASGVWFPGGRQWRLADAYLDTRTQRELVTLLRRGGVIGGSSAGASILASFLVRGAREGNHIVIAPDHVRGFGFLRNTAIDQHLLVRRRQQDLLEVIDLHPELLGIGIDEGTAILVDGDTFEVLGRSRVAVYDDTPLSSETGYYFLESGDRYDMRERVVTGDSRGEGGLTRDS